MYQSVQFLEVQSIKEYFYGLKIIFLSTGLLTDLIPGKFKRDPRTGTLLMKPTTTGKKPLRERNKVLRTYTFSITKIANQVQRKSPIKILNVLETLNFS